MDATRSNEPVFDLGPEVLTPVVDTDVDALLDLFHNQDVRRYLLDGTVVEREWVEEVVADSRRDFAEQRAGLWVVREGPTGSPIGFVGVRDFFDPPRPSLIYGLDPAHWGRGLVTRAAELVVAYLFDDLGWPRVEAATDPPNRASIAVLERLGFDRFVPLGPVSGGGAFGETLFFERFARGPEEAPPVRIAFLCTHNSARSQMAEALVRHRWPRRRIEAYSAGVVARGVHEGAIAALTSIGVDAAGLESKTVDELTASLEGPLDVVVTVCDNAREACPYLPAKIENLHRRFADPSAVDGDEEERQAAFARARDEIGAWLEQAVPAWLAR